MEAVIDVTLIDAMLELTPEQRIQQNDRTLVMLEELKDGLAGAAHVLGAIEGGRDYEALEPDSIVIQVAAKPVRVLRLEKIVELERLSAHPKDLRMLPVLEAALARSRR